ncbi:IclR family transcriptional regulator [Paraburkholderia sediminicola]|uniref:IclR family transcriptional regulator n=1 Tax=Paraburkholderia metrosideri TaxID=580937 RepID=A0ABW9E5G7_9BURK
MNGTQSIERAVELLKQVARFGSRGASLSALSKRIGVPHPTVHRMLTTLSAVGFVNFNKAEKLYRIGPLAFELGLVAVTPFGELGRFEPIVAEVAKQTGDTAYLFLRNGIDVICLIRAEGDYIIKANVIEVGRRRPICDSVAGIAMLANMDPAETAELIARSALTASEETRLSPAQVEERVAFARTNGISYWTSVVMPDVSGAAIAAPSDDGQPRLSIAISAISSRLPEERLNDVKPILKSAQQRVLALL